MSAAAATTAGRACPPDRIDALTVSSSVNDGEKEDRVGDLPMEPDVLVEGYEPGQLRSENHDQVAQDGQGDERSIVA